MNNLSKTQLSLNNLYTALKNVEIGLKFIDLS